MDTFTIQVRYVHVKNDHGGLQSLHNGLLQITFSSYILIIDDLSSRLNWFLLAVDSILSCILFHIIGKLWNGNLAEKDVFGLATFLGILFARWRLD